MASISMINLSNFPNNLAKEAPLCREGSYGLEDSGILKPQTYE